jgi:hypothetical protein
MHKKAPNADFDRKNRFKPELAPFYKILINFPAQFHSFFKIMAA